MTEQILKVIKNPINNYKTGYIFICASSLKQPKIWEEYFKNAEDYQVIYLYYKCLPPVYNIKNITYVNISRYNPKWGNIDYVRSFIYGLELIFNNNNNIESAFLFSESCIPLHNIQHIHNIVNSSEKSLFELIKCYKNDGQVHYARLLHSKKKDFFSKMDFIYAYRAQGFCIKKNLANILIQHKEKYFNILASVPFIDEHYIIALLQLENINLDDFITSTTTIHFNWTDKSKNGKLPHVYMILDKKNTDTIANKYLFLRKVDETSNIKYVIDKIKSC